MPRNFDNGAFRKVLGARLKARRRHLELTQIDVAAAIKTSWQQVQKYEAGSNEPSIARLFLLAAVLQTTAARLIKET